MEEDNKPNMVEQGAKNVANKAKDTTRQAIKKAGKMAIKKVVTALAQAVVSLITTLLPYIAILVAVVVIITGFEYVLELITAEDTTTSVYSAMGIDNDDGNIVKGDIANIVEIKQDSQGYHLEFMDDFEERLESAVEELNKQNTSINLKNIDSLKKFIIAEAMTKYPNLGGESDGETKFQGTIQLRRLTPDKSPGEIKEAGQKEIALKYVDASTFDSYVNSNNLDALNFFTFDENKNIVTATWSYSNGSTTVQKNSPMNYRDVTSAYTMPFEYPLFFLIDGECEEFCIELADLAMASTMEITIVDDVTDSKNTTIVNTVKTTKTDTYTSETDASGNTTEHAPIFGPIIPVSNETNTTESMTETINSKIILTNVDSWAMKKESSISLQTSSGNNVSGPISGEDSSTDEQVSTTSLPISIVMPDGTLITNTITRTTRTITTTTTTTNTTVETEESRNIFNVNETEVEENSDKFVELYKKYKSTLNNNLLPSWLFEIMENNDKTSNLVELTKLLLYESTGNDYGVTSFGDIDFSFLKSMDSSQLGEGGNVQLAHDFIAQWENVYMYKYIYTNEYDDQYDNIKALYDYVSRDKKDFLCAEDIDTDNGTRNYGFGVLHYLDGNWNNQSFYAEEGINIEQEQYKVKGTPLSVDIVERVCIKVIEYNRGEILKHANTAGVTLNDNQLNALTYIAHRYGPSAGYYNTSKDGVPKFIELFKQYGDTEEFKRNCFAFNENSSDYTRKRSEALWKAFHEGVYVTYLDEIIDASKYFTASTSSSSVCSLGINLYNSDGSVNETEINNLYNKESEIISNYNNYEYFNNNGLSYLQCTWWANARASQFLSKYGDKYKKYPTTNGDGGQYWEINKENGYFEYGSEPRANSIICYAGGGSIDSSGHVAYVEAVDSVNKKIYISHCSRGTEWKGIEELDWNGNYYGSLPQGYIYLAPKIKEGEIINQSGQGYDNVFQSSSGNVYKLFIQRRFEYVPYWGNNVYRSGCGPSSAAIILSGFGTNDTPETVALSYAANGSWDGECKFFTMRGYNAVQGGVDWSKAIQHLKNGNPMVASINSYIQLNEAWYDGHFITFLDIDEAGEKIFIGDPGWGGAGTGWYKISYLKSSGAFGQFFYISK